MHQIGQVAKSSDSQAKSLSTQDDESFVFCPKSSLYANDDYVLKRAELVQKLKRPILSNHFPLCFPVTIFKLPNFIEICELKVSEMRLTINLNFWTGYSNLSVIKKLHPETNLHLRVQNDLPGVEYFDTSKSN